MRWRKLGRLYAAREAIHPKLASHAANPLPVRLAGDLYRVFYSGRDDANRSSIGAVDIDLGRRSVVRVHDRPLLEHGPAGSFYSHGVSIGNCYEANGQRYMLFMGWQRPPGAHWRGDIGRLIVDRDLSLRPEPGAPLLGTSEVDPVSLSYPWALRGDDGRYRMWYGSTLAWDAGNGEMLHVIHVADSPDGDQWTRRGMALPYELGRAQAFSHPSVLARRDGGHDMWFSYRGVGATYRIGYASCEAGGPWRLRLDEAGIDVSPSGWDSEMVEYPFVFDHEGERFMLYNGDGFGRSGFGLAVLE